MLLYLGFGARDYEQLGQRVYRRGRWEFQAIIGGRAAPRLGVKDEPPLQGPRLYVSGPDHPHGWQGQPGAPCQVAVAHFDDVPDLVRRQIRRDEMRSIELSSQVARRVRTMLEQLREDYHRPRLLTSLRVTRALCELSLLALSEQPDPVVSNQQEYARRKVSQALAWYGEHLAQRPTVDDLARAVFLSPSHLRRLFAAAGRGTPLAEMQAVQLAQARELMRRNDLPLLLIAGLTGFSSPSVFARNFKKATGLTPRAWRKQMSHY